MKTAKQMMEEQAETAKNLPTEVKKIFWKAMMEDRKNIGEASQIAGLNDIMVAAALVIQCHSKVYFPMPVDSII